MRCLRHLGSAAEVSGRRRSVPRSDGRHSPTLASVRHTHTHVGGGGESEDEEEEEEDPARLSRLSSSSSPPPPSSPSPSSDPFLAGASPSSSAQWTLGTRLRWGWWRRRRPATTVRRRERRQSAPNKKKIVSSSLSPPPPSARRPRPPEQQWDGRGWTGGRTEDRQPIRRGRRERERSPSSSSGCHPPRSTSLYKRHHQSDGHRGRRQAVNRGVGRRLKRERMNARSPPL